MKLYLIFLLMDILLFMAYGYLSLKYAFARAAAALEITKS